MIFIAFDGSGYETRLAESKDLVHWDVRGAILQRHGVGWDAEQAAGGVALVDNRWDGTWEIQSYDGQYWMSYLGGKSKGYETPPLSVATSPGLPTLSSCIALRSIAKIRSAISVWRHSTRNAEHL